MKQAKERKQFLQLLLDITTAFETRLKEFRQLNTGLWMNVETQMVTLPANRNANGGQTMGPADTAFGRKLREVSDCLGSLATLAPEDKDMRSLHFSVRGVIRKLAAKVDDAKVPAQWQAFFSEIHLQLTKVVLPTLEERMAQAKKK